MPSGHADAGTAGGVPGAVHRVLGQPGSPMDAGIRGVMEQRLGHDFGAVRIHADADAAASAATIQARAYTYGSHVVTGAGQYQPHTRSGQALLTHELTHVIQQSGSTQTGPPSTITGAADGRLTLGRPDDPLEREADRIADQVAGMSSGPGSITAAPGRLSRTCAPCAAEEKEREPDLLRTAADGSGEAAHGTVPGIVHEVLRSPGQPLDAATRALVEHRFGRDFSNVRIHHDARAAASARAVHAHAYTLGHQVVFGAGKYSPGSAGGTRLLAHELAHVVQQGGSHRAMPPAAVIRRSESVHPEEQYCQDLAEHTSPTCSAIIECIEDLIEFLAGHFARFRGDPGHVTRIAILQGVLKTLMVLAKTTCKDGEYDPELEEEAGKWANKKLGQKNEKDTGDATEEQKKTLRERLPTVPGWVWGVIAAAAAALLIACFASGVCEVAAIVAAVGDAVGTIIIWAMRLAGIGLLTQKIAAAPSGPDEATSAVA